MSLDPPNRFPNEAHKIREEALEFRRLSSEERFAQIFEFIANEEALMAGSPQREIARRLLEQEKAEWRRRMKDLITEYLERNPDDSAD